jgi:hypothetical protein
MRLYTDHFRISLSERRVTPRLRAPLRRLSRQGPGITTITAENHFHYKNLQRPGMSAERAHDARSRRPRHARDPRPVCATSHAGIKYTACRRMYERNLTNRTTVRLNPPPTTVGRWMTPPAADRPEPLRSTPTAYRLLNSVGGSTGTCGMVARPNRLHIPHLILKWLMRERNGNGELTGAIPYC